MEARRPMVKCWDKVVPSIVTALSSAFFEWVLIFMLFIDGGFGYLITKFAQYCRLQIPCLFCSRMDRVLGKERAGFYWDLVCYNHKLKISSLVHCHLHDNLVDVRGMCERCLFSFETLDKLNTETYRLIAGKLGAEACLVDEDPLLEDCWRKRNCFCCKEQCGSKGFARKLLQITSFGSEADKLDAPFPVENADDRDDEEIRNRFCQFSLSEYKNVRITSESESDAAISDDERENSKPDSIDRCIHPEPQNITLAEDLTPEKLIHPSSVSVPPSNQVLAQDVDHELREINLRQAECVPEISAPSELTSFVEVPPSPKLESAVATMSIELEKETPKAGSDFIPSSEIPLDSKPDTTDTSAQMGTSLDLGDAYKLATSGRVRQLSGKFLKQMSFKDSTQNSEDLKLLLSQFSANRGIESSSLNDIGSRLSVNSDELKGCDGSMSLSIQMIQRKISLERNESNISLDGSTVSEIEGESMVDRLKRQVEHDKRFIGALYKELEEERSASAVAANQAMAMITRLQEEKAALQMEALQCLRMMEEQADFDNEALQKANENVVAMEKIIRDLEGDLGEYKKKFGDITLLKEISTENSEETRTRISDTKWEMAKPMAGSSTLDFENEKLYITRCVKKLEEALNLFSNNAAADMINGEFSAEEWVKVSNPVELDRREDCQGNSEIEVGHLQQDAIKEKGIPCSQQLSTMLPHKLRNVAGGIELDALRNELSTLTDRLKLVEAEHNIIQHSINSLGTGEEGVKFIREIAGYLQKLHSRKDQPSC
ncbi:PREDICTED: myosin-binding protein 1 [Ipomoea nil]|uniref:myosin-binding protein 1 n=1 Tax=Ipomoea nil TaxID=35883 RepID=UPI00090092DD|nr:PREDICTED: myosin-binding protein 1 [Ipomoea nil]